MKPRKTTYLVHRWIGLLISIQLLAWSAGGLIFSVLDIDLVRGERDSIMTPYDPLEPIPVGALPSRVAQSAELIAARGTPIGSIALLDRGVGPFWELESPAGEFLARLDPETGAVMPLLTADQAEELATRDLIPTASITTTTLIEHSPPTEYRSGPLPAYAVSFDHDRGMTLYVDANTGQITARRNTPWRVFDFFWMLHTMDYQGRDDFNHPLLTTFSVLAIATSGTGLSLWAWRFGSRMRHRSERSVLGAEE